MVEVVGAAAGLVAGLAVSPVAIAWPVPNLPEPIATFRDVQKLLLLLHHRHPARAKFKNFTSKIKNKLK